MVLVTAAVEHNRADAGRLGALGNDLADGFGGGDVATTLQCSLGFLVDGTCRSERVAAAVVDDLRVNVAHRAVHAQARTLRSAGNAGAHSGMNPLAMRVFR